MTHLSPLAIYLISAKTHTCMLWKPSGQLHAIDWENSFMALRYKQEIALLALVREK